MILFLISFLSFILEFIFNNLFYNSLFVPLIIVVSIILLEPYFKNKKRYFIYCFVIGFFYDLIYTNTFFMNASLFFILGFGVVLINKNFSDNFLVFILKIVFFIILYRVLSFVFLVISGIVDFNFKVLFKGIYCSLIFNVFYSVFGYFLLKKFKVKRIF